MHGWRNWQPAWIRSHPLATTEPGATGIVGLDAHRFYRIRSRDLFNDTLALIVRQSPTGHMLSVEDTRTNDCSSALCGAPHKADYVDTPIMCSHGRFRAATARAELQASISSST